MRKRYNIWINSAVGVLGLIVGGSYFYRWFGGEGSSKDLLLGIACLAVAAAWLIYTLVTRNAAMSKEGRAPDPD